MWNIQKLYNFITIHASYLALSILASFIFIRLFFRMQFWGALAIPTIKYYNNCI